MAHVLTVEYDCGTEYEVPVSAQLGRNTKTSENFIKGMTKILDARHDRECGTCGAVKEPVTID